MLLPLLITIDIVVAMNSFASAMQKDTFGEVSSPFSILNPVLTSFSLYYITTSLSPQ